MKLTLIRLRTNDDAHQHATMSQALLRMYATVLTTCCLLAVANGGPVPVPQLRFTTEPPPFAYVTDKTQIAVPCASSAPAADIRWVTQEDETGNTLVPLNIPSPCPNKSLVIAGAGTKFKPKLQCSLKLADNSERLLTKPVICMISLGNSTLLSRPVSLMRVSDIARPTVRTVSVSNQVFENGVIHLRCHIQYDKPYLLQYSWLVDGSPLRTTPLSRVSVISYGELYIRNATEADTQRKYKCIVQNTQTGQNLTSDEALRLVYTSATSAAPFAPVRCDDQPSEVSLAVSVGGVAELTCPICAYPSPTFSWTAIDAEPSEERVERLGGLMVIRNVQQTDAGEYRCDALNSATGHLTSFKWTLLVKKPLQLNVTPTYSEVAARDNVELQCSIEGNGQETHAVAWYHNGKFIHSEDANDDISVLRLTNISRTSRGFYQCLVIRKESEPKIGQFVDVSGDPFSSATGTAFLNVTKELPEIHFISPDSTNVSKESQYRTIERQLECRATGVPLPVITWQLDGELLVTRTRQVVLDEHTTVSYVNVTLRNDTSGRYTCEASNTVGKVSRTTLLFWAGASHSRQLRSPNVTLFRSSNWTVGCYSLWPPQKPGITVEWRRSESNAIVEDEKVYFDKSMPGASLLVITSIENGNEGMYYCYVSDSNNSKASVSQRLYIRVEEQPSLDISPVPNEPYLGQSLALHCSSRFINTIGNTRWYKDGKLIFPTPKNANATNATAKYSPCIVPRDVCMSISKLDSTYNGDYVCEMDTQHGTKVSKVYSLAANYLPQFDDASSSDTIDIRVIKGSDVTLGCSVSGYPQVTLTWTYSENGLNLKNSQPINTERDGRFVIHQNSSLLIRRVEEGDSNLYSCDAKNRIGSINRKFNVSVFVPVHVEHVSGPTDAEVVVGINSAAPTELHCRVFGDRPINVTWYHDRKALTPIRKKLQITVNDSDPNVIVSTLSISKLVRSDGGLYFCNATNRFVAASSLPPERIFQGSRNTALNVAVLNFSVTVREPPSRIEDINIFNLTNTSTELRWRIPSDGQSVIVSYIVDVSNSTNSPSAEKWVIAGAHDYRTVRQLCIYTPNHERACDGYLERYSDNTEERVTTTSTHVTLFIDRLAPAFTYVVSVTAHNDQGASPTSTLDFTTAEAPPDAAPIIKHVIALNDTSLFVAWQPPPVLSQRGELLRYYIHYERCGLAEKFPPIMVHAPPKAPNYDPRTGQVNYTLTALRRFTSYCVRVSAYNSRGSGPSSTTVQQLTAESVPTESPKSVHCSAVSPTTMKVSWEPPSLPSMNGVLQRYTVTVKTQMADENEDNVTMEQVQHTETVLRGLQPASSYSIIVQARTRVGDGVPSEPIVCRTSDTTPAKPRQVRAIQLNGNSALVVWQPPAQYAGELIDYIISTRTQAGETPTEFTYMREWSFFTRNSSCTNNCGQVITGLLTNNAYEFSVKGVTAAGPGDSNTASLIMQPNKPAMLISFGETLSVPIGSSVMLNCLVIGSPTLRWSRDKSIMSLSSEKYVGLDNNSIIIKNVQSSDSGSYSCTANNLEAKYELVVSPGQSCRVPEKPRLLQEITTQTSIQLRWSTKSNGNCPIRAFMIRWRALIPNRFGSRYGRTRRQIVDTTQQSDLIVVRSSERSKQFVALKCGTLYEFTITANNSMGPSAPEQKTIRTDGTNLNRPLVKDVLREVNSTYIRLTFDQFLNRDSCPLSSVTVSMKNQSGGVILSRELGELEAQRPLNITVQPQTMYYLKIIARSDSDVVELDEIRLESAAYQANLPISVPISGEAGVVKGAFDNWAIIVPVAVCIAFVIVLAVLAKVLYGRRTRATKHEEAVRRPASGTQRQTSTEANPRSLLLNNAEPLSETTPAANNRRNGQHTSPSSEIRVLDGSKMDHKGKQSRDRPSRDGRPHAAGDNRPVERQASDDSAGIKKKRGLINRALQFVLRTLFGSGVSEYEDVPIDESNVQSPASRQAQPANANNNPNRSGSSTIDNGVPPGSQSPANHSTLEDLPPGRPNRLAPGTYRRSSSYEARNRPLPTNRRERTSSDRSNLSRSQYYSGGEYAALDDTAIGCTSNTQQPEIDCSKSMMTESWVYSGGDPIGMSRSMNTATSIDNDGHIQPYATFHLTPKRTRGGTRNFDEPDPYRLTLPHGHALQPSTGSAFVRQQPAADCAQLMARQLSYNPSTNNANAMRQQAAMRRIHSQTDAQPAAIELAVVAAQPTATNAGDVSRVVKPIATNPLDKPGSDKAPQPLIGAKPDSAFRPVPNRYTVRGKPDTADASKQSADTQAKCDVATSPLDVKSDTIDESYSNSNLTASECATSALLVHAPPGAHLRAPSATTMSSNHDELAQLYDSIKGRAQQYTLREDVEEGTLVDGRTHKLANDDKRTLTEEEPVTTCETESSPGAPNGAGTTQPKPSAVDAAAPPVTSGGPSEPKRGGHVAAESGSSDSGIRNFTKLPPLPNEHRQTTCEVLLRRPEAKPTGSQQPAQGSQQPPNDALALATTPKRERQRKPRQRVPEPCDDIHVTNENQHLVFFQNQPGRHNRTVTDNVLLGNPLHPSMYRAPCVTCTQIPQTAPILPPGLMPGACMHAHVPLPTPPTHPYHTYYPPHTGTVTYGAHMQVPLEYYASYTPLPAANPRMALQSSYGMMVAQQPQVRSLARRPSEGGSVYYSSTPDETQMTNVLSCVHSAFATTRTNYGISNPVALMAPSACPTGANSTYDSVADCSSPQEQLDEQSYPYAMANASHHAAELPKSARQPAVFELHVPKIHQQVYGSAAKTMHTPSKVQLASSSAAAAKDSNDANRSSPSTGTATVTAYNAETNEAPNAADPGRAARVAMSTSAHPASEHYEDTIDV